MRDEIANLVHPLFNYALSTREQLVQGKPLHLEDVQAVCKGLLGGDLELPAWADFRGDVLRGQHTPAVASRDDQFLGIRYALVCWLDEIFIVDSPWSEPWSMASLEIALYGMRERAHNFWVQARLADARLGSDAVEVFLLCVLLGFRGELQEHPEQLRAWVAAARARFRPPEEPPVESDRNLPEKLPHLPPLLGRERLLWRLLEAEQPAGEFPEQEAAWEEGIEALNKAGIDLHSKPLFLVIGRPAGGEDALFEAAATASETPLLVRNAPRSPEAQLHFFATPEAIYVTCPGVGLLARQITLLACPDPANVNGPDRRGQAQAAGRPIRAFDTLGTKRSLPLGEVPRRLAQTREHVEPTPGSPRRLEAPEVELCSNQLRALCRRIVRARRPGAPLNGILALLPVAASNSDDDARLTGLACQRDVAAIREVTQLSCPVVALVCDLETVPGFTELMNKLPADLRQRRQGQSFPLPADAATVPPTIAKKLAWICQQLFPAWIYEHMRLETPGQEAVEVLRGNRQLYRLLCQLRARQNSLTLLLKVCSRGSGIEEGGQAQFAGAYLGATGRDATREQAFAVGVVQSLLDCSNRLSWNAEALAEDRMYHRWALWSYFSLTGLLMVGVGLLLGLIFQRL